MRPKLLSMFISIINRNKQKPVFVKTPWRALKLANGVNNLFYNTFSWFYGFWLYENWLWYKSDQRSLFLGLIDKSGLIGLFLSSLWKCPTFHDKSFKRFLVEDLRHIVEGCKWTEFLKFKPYLAIIVFHWHNVHIEASCIQKC